MERFSHDRKTLVPVSVRYFCSQPMDEKIKTRTLRFPPKKTLIYTEGIVRLANCVTV